MQLSTVLQGIFSQRLVQTIDKKRRVLACEILLANKAVRNLIREDQIGRLRNAIFTGRSEGMQTMEDSLAALYRQGLIGLDEAMRWANEPQELQSLIRP